MLAAVAHCALNCALTAHMAEIEPPYLAGLSEQDSDKLNKVMASYLGEPEWSNAYEQNQLPDTLLGIRDAVKTAFGARLPAVTARTAGQQDSRTARSPPHQQSKI
jgi:hypothetical protein